MESKEDKFKRLATQRTNEVLYRLKVLGNCANQQLYDYGKKDVDKIFFEIERRTKEIKAKFNFPENKDFRL